MANASLLYENLADAGVVTASSWIAAAPPSTMQNEHVSRRWKGRSGDTEFVLLDLGALKSIDTVALLGLQGVFGEDQRNLSSAAISRVRLSSIDPLGTAGDVYDSGSQASRIREPYGVLIDLLGAPVAARYVRIDLSEATASALLAGRIVAGLRSSFSINFQYGWSFGYGDLSRKSKSASGQTFVDRDDRFRVLSVSFGFMSDENRFGFVDAVDRMNGVSSDVLFIIDPESTQPDRDSVWGLLQDMSPPTQPVFEVFAKSYAIEERR